MRIIYVKNKGKFTSIPISEVFYKRVNDIYSYDMSLGFIMDFRHFVEIDTKKEDWAPYVPVFKENGEINLEDNPLNDCLAAIYYIFNYINIDINKQKNLPNDIAFLITHAYNVLHEYFIKIYDDEFKTFYLDIDNWNVVGYMEHIK